MGGCAITAGFGLDADYVIHTVGPAWRGGLFGEAKKLRSGSMAGLEKDTIGGFNAMVEKQKAEAGEAFISTVLFDNTFEVIHDRLTLDRIPKLTEKEYYIRGCTALLDAVGGSIHHIGNVHKYAREEDRPEKTLFVITTDGMKNASRRHTYDLVSPMAATETAAPCGYPLLDGYTMIWKLSAVWLDFLQK